MNMAKFPHNATRRLHNAIMWRVWLMFLVRRASRPGACRVYVLLVLTWQMLVQVSISNVLNNTPAVSEFRNLYTFYTQAVLHTEFSVQLVLIGLGVLGSWYAWQGVRVLRVRRGTILSPVQTV